MPITAAAPTTPVTSEGRPALGAYRGYAERVVWDGLAGAHKRGGLWRKLHQKTWQYAGVMHEACVVAVAVIDVGFATSAFMYVFDRRERRLLADLSFTGTPRAARFSDAPGPGASARFEAKKALLAITREAGAWRIACTASGLEIDATLGVGGAPPPLCAVADIPGAVANCTHKTVGLDARGFASAGGVRFDLAGGTGALDHTRGLLARDTRWRWASASRPGLSLNLVEDFNGPVENVVWLGDELHPIGPVAFSYNPRATQEPWRIVAANGSLELDFVPEGERREDKNLLIAKSWYVQPIGTFRGVIRVPGKDPIDVRDLVGVTEDHVAKW